MGTTLCIKIRLTNNLEAIDDQLFPVLPLRTIPIRPGKGRMENKQKDGTYDNQTKKNTQRPAVECFLGDNVSQDRMTQHAPLKMKKEKFCFERQIFPGKFVLSFKRFEWWQRGLVRLKIF